ncbi:mscS [Symbiodinium sp. KB8]|nr:mscS [Symbiodinium sp. KB8]
MKPVIISILLHAVILLYTASGVLRTLGLAPRSILALGGVSGLAFGLAAQNLVGNFMSGLLLVLNRQFTVGDYIETNGIQGKVLAMGWTFIEIQRGEDLVMLPNSQVIGTTVVQIGRLADPGGDDASESTNA